jgi:predicted nucleotidyltransferase component of viral defense system
MNEQALKERLKTIAKEKNTVFQDVWMQLLLERFLFRLAQSNYSEQFIFKGGLLLSKYLEIGRETKDLDFLLEKMEAQIDIVSRAINDICIIENYDEFRFSLENVQQLQHLHMNYPGFRAKLKIIFGNMKDTVQLDIGVGDVVDPVEYDMTLFTYRDKPLFEGSVSLQVYPIETIFSEKLEAMVSRGEFNSRMKDFHDVVLMLRDDELLDKSICGMAIKKTFAHRKTNRKFPLHYENHTIEYLQTLWSRHLSGLGNYKDHLKLPGQFVDVVNEINHYISMLGQ